MAVSSLAQLFASIGFVAAGVLSIVFRAPAAEFTNRLRRTYRPNLSPLSVASIGVFLIVLGLLAAWGLIWHP